MKHFIYLALTFLLITLNIQAEYLMKQTLNINSSFLEEKNPTIIKNGLILHLDSLNTDSYSGTGNIWYDLTDNNLDASAQVSMPTWTGNYFHFNGNVPNDFVLMSNEEANAFLGDDFSYSVWFKSNTNRGVDGRILNRDPSDYFSVVVKQGQNFPQPLVIKGSPEVFTTGGLIEEDTWYNITVTLSKGVGVIAYLNGNQLNTANQISWNGGIGSSRPIVIGNDTEANVRTATTYSFTGGISNVMFYNKVLTKSEIMHNYNIIKQQHNF